jgi:uncharacterized protein (DUF433 family)/DNA-binding transcriptional MerR regulator
MVASGQHQTVASALDISSVIAAFSEEQVQRITGLTVGRLRYWARTDFFKPSFVEENQRLPYSRFYSFKDVVALRTLEMLRVQNNVPLQQLRIVAEKLAYLKDDLWTSTTLFVENRKVAVVNSESGAAYEVASGQYLLRIPLKKVVDDTKADILAFRSRSESDIGHVSRRRGVIQNALVVSGTRIPVGAIIRLNEDGYSVDRIIDEYPDLRKEDIEAALRYGKTAA